MEGLTPNPTTPAPAVHPEQSNVQASLATQQQQSITTGYEPNAQPPPWMSADQQLEWYLAQHAAQRHPTPATTANDATASCTSHAVLVCRRHATAYDYCTGFRCTGATTL